MDNTPSLWDGLRRKLSSVSDETWSLLLLAILCALIEWAAYYYFDLNVALILGGSGIAAFALTKGMLGFLPLTKKRLEDELHALFGQTAFKWSLLSACCVIVVTGLLWTRIALDWRGDPITVTINGKERSIGEKAEPVQSESRFDWSWRKLQISVGHVYAEDFSYRWVRPRRINIPTYAIDALGSTQRSALHLLALSFFDHDTKEYLNAANKLALPETEASLREIRVAHGILQVCFEADNKNYGPDIATLYSYSYPSSAFVPLLKSCFQAKVSRFSEAATSLESFPKHCTTPCLEAYLFFRALNLLNQYKREAVTTGKRNQGLIKQLHADLDKVEDAAKTASAAADFRKIVGASARFHRGLAYFYDLQLDKARQQFDQVTKEEDDKLKTRAWNALGYIAAMRANFDEARQHFTSALKVSRGSDSRVSSNLGMLYMDQGDYKRAAAELDKFIADSKFANAKELALVKLARAVIRSESLDEVAASAEFGKILIERGRQDYSYIDQPDLRYGNILLEIGEMLELDHRFQGHELTIMAFYGRAYLAVKTAPGGAADDIRKTAVGHFQRMRAIVHPEWLKRTRSQGFFKPAYDLLGQTGP